MNTGWRSTSPACTSYLNVKRIFRAPDGNYEAWYRSPSRAEGDPTAYVDTKVLLDCGRLRAMELRRVSFRADSTPAQDLDTLSELRDTTQSTQLYLHARPLGRWKEVLLGSDEERFYLALCREVQERTR